MKDVFVGTKVCLSQQNFCHDKIMFVAAPTMDNDLPLVFVITSVVHGSSPTETTPFNLPLVFVIT